MSDTPLPSGLRRALRALERRLFAVLLAYGVGRAVAKLCGLLALLYVLDRLFVPPAAARFVLAGGALTLWAWHLRHDLLVPLRSRPSRTDLASLWERQVPGLGDRLLTAVELHGRGDRGSVELIAAVTREAEAMSADLDAPAVVPTGRARRSLLGGTGTLAALLAGVWLAPTEAWIFLQRLGGAEVAWPSDTVLELLPAYVEGTPDAVPLEPTGAGTFRLAVARGSVISLRVRADGEVPDEVLAYGFGEPRRLHLIDRGVFVLRMPPLQEDVTLRFRGGDDTDGLPRVQLEAGDAPAVDGWTVRMEPPVYAGLPIEEGPLHELRALRNAQVELRFSVDRPAARAEVIGLDGERIPLQADVDGDYRHRFVVTGSGELAVALTGTDGFRQERASVLRWDALADRPPQLRFAWPRDRWRTVPGAPLPLVIVAEDDYGIDAVGLYGAGDARVDLPSPDGARRIRQLVRADAPSGGDGGVPADSRFRFRLSAQDRAEPDPQASEIESDWIEVLPPAFHEQQLAERMVRLRARVERLRDRADSVTTAGEVGALRSARRVRRDLEGMVADTEADLVERLYSGLDGAAPRALDAVEAVLAQGDPATGALVEALDTSGATLPGERVALLLDLARALRFARAGAAEALVTAVEDGADPAPQVDALVAELDAILEILIAWEDFQSAVNLLRDLLERQRALYLRTREASNG